MKEVVILGGGFAGVSAASHLLKKVSGDEINITLIDKNPYHLFTPSLYEVATSEEPRKNISIPYTEIFQNKIRQVRGDVSTIDLENKLIRFDKGMSYSFDYLIIALGSEPAFFDVEGLKKYSLPLKNLEDAVKIKEKIEEAYHKNVHRNKSVNIVVGGGGFSGTELTAELVNYGKHLARHHGKALDKVKITIIQGSNCLLKELDEKVSGIAQKRLEKENVKIVLGAHIKKVDEENVETDDGKKYTYDILAWTGGVRANSVLSESGLKVNGRGQVSVDDKMQISNFNNIFAAGDVAEFADPVSNKPAPGVAEVAEDEGKIAAENVYRRLKEKEPVSYKYKHSGYIIPLTGKFAVCDLTKFRTIGFLGWCLQQLVFLYYLLKILPFSKAFKRWNKFEMYLVENS